MLAKVLAIKSTTRPLQELDALLQRIHKEGPYSSDILESISLYKEFHRSEFSLFEEKFVSALGLFYKNTQPANLYSLLLATIGNKHLTEFGRRLTPVQASVRRAVEKNQFVSISAPTSAGKSYSIRDFLADAAGDAVVVVPSRALIAEYVNAIRRRFNGAKNVIVSAFVDDVYKARDLRHIFVLTPERARELFTLKRQLPIEVFFFDEAQMSEEKERGLLFDILVRRVRRNFPQAKIIFAHPFVDNPEAQLKKHSLDKEGSYSRAYSFGTVGKVSVFKHANGKDFVFSPFDESGHLLSRCVEFDGGFENFAFNGKHSVLIYVSKASIYNGKFLEPFQKYIDNLAAVTSARGAEIISDVEAMIGADDDEHRSRLVALLRQGVVIHHGSVPLDVRFLVENFIREGFARICFATSTLAQGVNMPFDIVWLHSMRMNGEGVSDKSLSFKNLIGRAGRLTDNNAFDYGYVFTENAKLYAERLNEGYTLSEVSHIDSGQFDDSFDAAELINSLKDDTFDDDLNLASSKVDRLSQIDVQLACRSALDLIYAKPSIRESVSGRENEAVRRILAEDFRTIYQASIGRLLLEGEAAVFSNAIMIFLLAIGGRTFKEIAGIRYSRIARRDEGKKGTAAFSQAAARLPDASLVKPYPLFKDISARDISYDAVVFDTYDYMDQVISFSLSEVFAAAFKIYGRLNIDSRHEKMLELLRYGTNDVVHMLLMRYGFAPESIGEVSKYIAHISEDEIIFNDEINSAPYYIREMAEWYRP